MNGMVSGNRWFLILEESKSALNIFYDAHANDARAHLTLVVLNESIKRTTEWTACDPGWHHVLTGQPTWSLVQRLLDLLVLEFFEHFSHNNSDVCNLISVIFHGICPLLRPIIWLCFVFSDAWLSAACEMLYLWPHLLIYLVLICPALTKFYSLLIEMDGSFISHSSYSIVFLTMLFFHLISSSFSSSFSTGLDASSKTPLDISSRYKAHRAPVECSLYCLLHICKYILGSTVKHVPLWKRKR